MLAQVVACLCNRTGMERSMEEVNGVAFISSSGSRVSVSESGR